MRIAIIGPGIMPIPPKGWGAVEILIWDYYQELLQQGHEVDIINHIRKNTYEQTNINSEYCKKLINSINKGNYDFVHIHYDCLYKIIPFLTSKLIGISSHYPYIDQIEKHKQDGFTEIFNNICNNENFVIFSISQKDYNQFIKYCKSPENIVLMLNGANSNIIKPLNTRKYNDKSIYIGKIEQRKQQYKYCSLQNIDFYGKCNKDDKFYNLEQFKGEFAHDELMKILPEYGNLVLLSIGENGTPLVVKEALMAGLPVVINSYSSNDIDTSKPFIDIIPNNQLDNLDYIQTIINKNKKYENRNIIRDYAVNNFSWSSLIKIYIENIQSLLSKKQSHQSRKLKLCIIGPNSPIPPIGWGAVESLIWDYKCYLEQNNCEVLIVNKNNDADIISIVNNFKPDIVHINYDDFWYLWDSFHCKKIIITNHYAYIENTRLRKNDHMSGISKSNAFIHCLSKGIQNVYINDYKVPIERTFVLQNGACVDKFKFSETVLYPNKSIYLAKIDIRKRQYMYQGIECIDFVGNYANSSFNTKLPNYIGEWDKQKLYNNLTNYSNLVLLSDGEAHPLVCCEALICGLGLVVSEFASANLDKGLPWINVIPTNKLNDIDFVRNVVIENQRKSIIYRNQIREYGIRLFSWNTVIHNYLNILNNKIL